MSGRPVSLALSASGGPCAVAVRDAGGAVHVQPPLADGRGDDLAAQVELAFENLGTQPRDVGEVRLDLGPGSYTGLRIAVTFARVLQSFLGVEVRTTTRPELLALAAWSADMVPTTRAIRPVLDARRDRFHHARVELADTTVLADPPHAGTRQELFARIRDDEILLAEVDLHEMLSRATPAPSTLEPVTFGPELLFDDRIGLRTASQQELEPLYLMGSYAE